MNPEIYRIPQLIYVDDVEPLYGLVEQEDLRAASLLEYGKKKSAEASHLLVCDYLAFANSVAREFNDCPAEMSPQIICRDLTRQEDSALRTARHEKFVPLSINFRKVVRLLTYRSSNQDDTLNRLELS